MDTIQNLHHNCSLSVLASSDDILPRKGSGHPLYGCRNLSSLDCSWRGNRNDQPVNAKALLSSSPSLEVLRLDNRQVSIWQPNAGPFLLSQEDKLPNLKELELRNFYLQLYQPELWYQCGNWEYLRHLSINVNLPVEFLECFSGHLPSLRSFEIRALREWDKPSISVAVQKFLRSTEGLVNFVSYNVPKSILSTLTTYHGKSLRTLRFRWKIRTAGQDDLGSNYYAMPMDPSRPPDSDLVFDLRQGPEEVCIYTRLLFVQTEKSKPGSYSS